MFPSDVWLLLDDNQLSFSGPATWAQTSDGSGRWLGNTSSYDGSPGGAMAVTFQGLSIAFTGNTPSVSNSNTTFLAGIDSNEPYEASFPGAVTQFYTQWYQTPTLQDGLHTVNLSEITVDVDYALVAAGESTPFGSGTTIVVDNSNTEIRYNGSWVESDVQIVPGGGWMSGPALGNTTHRSRTVGDSWEFKFAGTNIGVYGVFQWNATGSLTVDFTLDGHTTTSSLFVPSGVSRAQSETPHYEFFFSNVSSGNHTLDVSITQSVGSQIFVLDYLTYEPSFSTLATKPNFTVTASSASTVSHSSVNSGAIAGGVVGGIVGLIVILLGLFFFFRRKTGHQNVQVEEGLTSPRPFEKNHYQATGYSQTSEAFLPPAAVPASPSGDSSLYASPVSPVTSKGRPPSEFNYSASNGSAVFRPLRFGETPSVTNDSVDQMPMPVQPHSLDPNTNTQVQIEELRRRIEEMAREGVTAPPAYF